MSDVVLTVQCARARHRTCPGPPCPCHCHCGAPEPEPADTRSWVAWMHTRWYGTDLDEEETA